MTEIRGSGLLPMRGMATSLFSDIHWIEVLGADLDLEDDDLVLVGAEDEDGHAPGQGINGELRLVGKAAPTNGVSIPPPRSPEGWEVLFANLCFAVAHNAPWSVLHRNEDDRIRVMKHVVELFKEKFADDPDVLPKIREVLHSVSQRETVMLELQAVLTSFCSTHAVWRGCDSYRSVRNFLSPEDFKAFQESCAEKAQRRLNIVTRELSGTAMSRVQALQLFKSIQESSACFGGRLTIFFHSVESPALQEHKGANLSIELQTRRAQFGEVTVRKSPVFDGQKGLWEWSPPHAAGLFVGNGEILANEAQLVVRIKSPTWGCFSYKDVAEISIPMMHLFEQMDDLRSKARAAIGTAGFHLCHGRFTDEEQKCAVELTIALTCLEPIHNCPPPSVRITHFDTDLAREQSECEARVEKADKIWKIDHHAEVFRLLEMLGNLEDEEYVALQLYCDLFLIHQELFDIGTLCATALRDNWRDDKVREFSKLAVKALLNTRPALRTHTCVQYADKTLASVRGGCIGRLCRLEEELTTESASEGLREILSVLDMVGVSAKEIPQMISQRMSVISAQKVRKILKIARSFLPNNALGPRMSALVELEEAPDKGRDTKTALLFRFVAEIFVEIERAIQFARATGDRGVEAIAVHRVEVLLLAVHPPLKDSLTAIYRDLAASVAPVNPLGDSLGVIAHLYRRSFSLIAQLWEYSPLNQCCENLAELFDNYLPNWISLSRNKVRFWVDVAIQSPLAPEEDGVVFSCCCAPDAMQMFDEMFHFFYEIARIGDPLIESASVLAFCKMFAENFVEYFVESLAKKGKRASTMEEWLVCYSTLHRFQKLVTAFWKKRVFGKLLETKRYDAAMKLAECSVIRSEAADTLMKEIDGFLSFVCSRLTEVNAKVLSVGNDANLTIVQFCDYVEREFEKQMRTTIDGIDSKLCDGDLLPGVIRSFHTALDRRVLQLSSAPLTVLEKDKCNALLEVIEHVCERVGKNRVDAEKLFSLSRQSRQVIHLASMPSSDLVQSIEKSNRELTVQALSRGEMECYLKVLRERKDRDATKFLRILGQ